MRRVGSRTVPYVLPFVFGGPPQTHLDHEHAEAHRAAREAGEHAAA